MFWYRSEGSWVGGRVSVVPSKNELSVIASKVYISCYSANDKGVNWAVGISAILAWLMAACCFFLIEIALDALDLIKLKLLACFGIVLFYLLSLRELIYLTSVLGFLLILNC